MLPAAWCHYLRTPNRTVDLVIGGALLLIVPFLFIGGPDVFSSRLYQSTWSLGHLLLFAGLTLLLVRHSPVAWSWQFLWLVTLGFAALAGGLVEVVQGVLGRTPSFVDWSWDLLGSAIGLVALRVLPAQWFVRWLITAIVVGSLGVILSTPLMIAVDDLMAARQFPVLANFETPLELSRWRGRDYLRIQNKHSVEGRHSLQVTLPPGLYSGTSFSHFPRDWSGYSRLEFHVHNPSADPLPITVKIYDQLHVTHGRPFADRYNGRRTLKAGWNHIRVDLAKVRSAPAEREMDLQHVHNLQIFTARLKQARTIYIDDLRLIR